METNLRTVLKAHGLSQSEAARRMGVSRQALGAWARDDRGLGLGVIMKLARAIGCTPADIIPGCNEVPPPLPEPAEEGT